MGELVVEIGDFQRFPIPENTVVFVITNPVLAVKLQQFIDDEIKTANEDE